MCCKGPRMGTREAGCDGRAAPAILLMLLCWCRWGEKAVRDDLDSGKPCAGAWNGCLGRGCRLDAHSRELAHFAA
jgi:hypothetical protein